VVSLVVDDVEVEPSPVATSLVVLEVVVREVDDVVEPPLLIGAPLEVPGTTTVVFDGWRSTMVVCPGVVTTSGVLSRFISTKARPAISASAAMPITRAELLLERAS
jgi:hypothetical protein